MAEPCVGEQGPELVSFPFSQREIETVAVAVAEHREREREPDYWGEAVAVLTALRREDTDGAK